MCIERQGIMRVVAQSARVLRKPRTSRLRERVRQHPRGGCAKRLARTVNFLHKASRARKEAGAHGWQESLQALTEGA